MWLTINGYVYSVFPKKMIQNISPVSSGFVKKKIIHILTDSEHFVKQARNGGSQWQSTVSHVFVNFPKHHINFPDMFPLPSTCPDCYWLSICDFTGNGHAVHATEDGYKYTSAALWRVTDTNQINSRTRFTIHQRKRTFLLLPSLAVIIQSSAT